MAATSCGRPRPMVERLPRCMGQHHSAVSSQHVAKWAVGKQVYEQDGGIAIGVRVQGGARRVGRIAPVEPEVTGV